MIEEALVRKWDIVLEHPSFDPIHDDYKRYCVSLMMENVNKERMVEMSQGTDVVARPPASMERIQLMAEAAPGTVMAGSSSVASDGPIDIYDPILIGMVRRIAPRLIAYDVCGVQPMKGPTGTIFALRGRFNDQSGQEMFYNEANTAFSAGVRGNTAFTGNSQLYLHNGVQVGTSPSALYSNTKTYTVQRGLSTALAEMLGKDDGNRMNEISLTVEKVTVTAKSRLLRASYSVELAQDLMAIHGLSAENELGSLMTNEILAEMNREVIRSIYITATWGAQNCQVPGLFNIDVDADGRWVGEKVKGLLLQLSFESNEVAKATRFGKGNILICSSNVASALDMAKILHYSPELAKKLNVDDTGNTFVGQLDNGMKVFIDPYHTSTTNMNFAVVGYRGVSPWDAGLFYCPYVPLMYAKAVDPLSLQPAIGFRTRYGLVANPFATSSADGEVTASKKNRYYRLLAISNLL